MLQAATGSGKTAAVVLAWLWRRMAHPDAQVRASTPRRLLFALPMRVLVEQTERAAADWLAELGLADRVAVHVLMGGTERPTEDWRLRPDQPAIIVGTIDMLLSRALNRGYGEGRYNWPIPFALVSNDAHWILDEVQLLGPALATTRQLDALRTKLGTALPCSSTWMSATITPENLQTVDAPEVPAARGPSASDHKGTLASRLNAPKRLTALPAPAKSAHHVRTLADAAGRHERGTRTLIVVNTVKRAQEVHAALAGVEAERVLVHSRFRPSERRALDVKLQGGIDQSSAGQIVVATQVIEAGVDISSRLLITELAPWASMVQRAGRCNRYAERSAKADAELVWLAAPDGFPYDPADLLESAANLEALEGQEVTPASLAHIAQQPRSTPWQVLRRRDLVSLFDTAPDLSGNDIDVARFIRDGDDLDVFVAWRPCEDADSNSHAERVSDCPPRTDPPPARDELCAVSIGQFRKWLGGVHRAWRHDPRSAASRKWVLLTPADAPIDLKPGITVIVPADAGGYDSVRGWDPASREPVIPVPLEEGALIALPPEAMGEDGSSLTGRWVPLVDHLDHVGQAAAHLSRTLSGDLPDGAGPAIVRAAVLHDVGKGHPVFQNALVALEAESARDDRRRGGHWAKSDRRGGLRFERPGFRHELAGALAVDASGLLADLDEAELCRYLIAAHHGRVRLSAPALAEEVEGSVLGVRDGERLPGVDLPEGWDVDPCVPETTARLGCLELGGGWTAAALGLRDRPDLGPFRLAWCEMLVRIADWQASAMEVAGAEPATEGEHGG